MVVPTPTIQLEAITETFYQFSCPLRISLTPTPDFLASFNRQLSCQGIRLTNFGPLTEFLIAERVRLRTIPLPALLQDRAHYALKAKNGIFILVGKSLAAFDIFAKRVLHSIKGRAGNIEHLNNLARQYWEEKERPMVSFRRTTQRKRDERRASLSISNSFTLFVQTPVRKTDPIIELRETVAERQRRIQKGKFFLGPPFGARINNTKFRFPSPEISEVVETDFAEAFQPVKSAPCQEITDFVNSGDFGRPSTIEKLLSDRPMLTLAVPRSRYFASSSLLTPAQQESLTYHLKKVGMESCRLVYSSIRGQWNDPDRLKGSPTSQLCQAGKEVLIVARQGEVLAGGFNLTGGPFGTTYTFRLDTECVYSGESRRVSLQFRSTGDLPPTDSATSHLQGIPRRISRSVGETEGRVIVHPVGFDYEGKFTHEVLAWDAFEVFEVSLAQS